MVGRSQAIRLPVFRRVPAWITSTPLGVARRRGHGGVASTSPARHTAPAARRRPRKGMSMKLIVARVLPLALALLVPSLAFAETPAAGKPRATHVAKRAKAGVKA